MTNESKESVAGLAADIEQGLRGPIEEVRSMAEDWKDKAVSLVRENPGTCLLGAFVVGFALARAARHA